MGRARVMDDSSEQRNHVPVTGSPYQEVAMTDEKKPTPKSVSLHPPSGSSIRGRPASRELARGRRSSTRLRPRRDAMSTEHKKNISSAGMSICEYQDEMDDAEKLQADYYTYIHMINHHRYRCHHRRSRNINGTRSGLLEQLETSTGHSCLRGTLVHTIQERTVQNENKGAS